MERAEHSRPMPALASGDRQTAALGLIASAIGVAEFGLLPLLVQPSMALAVGFLLLVTVTTPIHWGLLHESVHGNLNRDKGWNQALGRSLAVVLCMSWEMMRVGHLLHHEINRHKLDRPEVIPDGKGWWGSAIEYYAKLAAGHAVISTIAPVALLLPIRYTVRVFEADVPDADLARVRAAVLRSFTAPARRRRIFTDLAIEAGLIALAVLLWGAWWPVFLGSVLCRHAVVSLMDNSHHYGTAVDSGRNARNTHLPAWARWLIMNQNFHGLHHAKPHLDWIELGAEARAALPPADGNWVMCILRQFRGPLRADQLVQIRPTV